jgi:hypothetical protein
MLILSKLNYWLEINLKKDFRRKLGREKTL